MTRFTKASTVSFSLMLIIAFLISLSSFASASKDVTIKGIKFGELLSGEDYSVDDLQDHVVAVEFWGKQ